MVRVSLIVMAAVLGLSSPGMATYSLVWSDEFNGTTLDTNNWAPDIGTGCPNLCGWGNNELEYYRAENVTVSGGNLVLTARDQSFGGSSFTSGKITTRGKQTFLYGRVEMRAKIPTGGGMWPAFWMLPQDDVYGGWASSGEIDIMEASNGTTSVAGTLHYGGSWPDNTYSGGSYSLGGANFADDFHIYAIEWEPDVMRWYVDGVLFSTKTSAQWFTNAAPGNPQAPFDQEFYIILNSAVGGNYTGCISPGCVTASFPQEFLVDYVRVYEDIVNEAPTVAITSPSSGGTLPAGDVTIDATASDNDGSVAKVEFYNGSVLLGEDTTAPYSYLWSSVTDGCYQIVARVIDDLGGTNDATADITVGTGCGQAAFPAGGIEFPTRIEAEDFDNGGEGVAYHDVDPGNNGGQYRIAEGVDVEVCADTGGGYDVGWLAVGEWMEYTVTVPTAGTYGFEARVASFATGGTFSVSFNGVDQTGSVTVPATGGWQTWTDVAFTATLAAGTQVMRFVPLGGEFNVNYFDVVTVPTAVLPDLQAAIVGFESYPNPFNPRTTVRFELQGAANVDLTIYDAQGRRVKGLAAAEAIGEGSHQRTWNGKDDTGRTVAGGVYFCRLDAGHESQTIRLVLLK